MRPAILALALLAALPARAETCLRGVNLSGAEFGDTPGKVDTDYTYPSEQAIQRLGKLGASAVRLPLVGACSAGRATASSVKLTTRK